MLVLCGKWRRPVQHVRSDKTWQDSFCDMDLQQDLLVHLHRTVHLRCTELIHWYHWRYIRKTKGSYEVSLASSFLVFAKVYLTRTFPKMTAANSNNLKLK